MSVDGNTAPQRAIKMNVQIDFGNVEEKLLRVLGVLYQALMC